MQAAMENIKQMADVNTVIGDAVETTDGNVIIPISKVGFGFAAGGSEFKSGPGKSGLGESGAEKSNSEHPFGGGAGGGVSITPMGFLVVGNGTVRLLSTDGNSQVFDRLIDMAPTVMERIQSMTSSS